MSFFDAFSLFLSFHELESVRILTHQSRNKEFKEFLCHPKRGIPVHILSKKVIVLRSYDVDWSIREKRFPMIVSRLKNQLFNCKDSE